MDSAASLRLSTGRTPGGKAAFSATSASGAQVFPEFQEGAGSGDVESQDSGSPTSQSSSEGASFAAYVLECYSIVATFTAGHMHRCTMFAKLPLTQQVQKLRTELLTSC